MREQPQSNDIIFYNTSAGDVKIEVMFNNETFWLTQKRLAELFGVEVPAISKHLKNIFESNELQEGSVVSKMETTAGDRNYILNELFYYNCKSLSQVKACRLNLNHCQRPADDNNNLILLVVV